MAASLGVEESTIQAGGGACREGLNAANKGDGAPFVTPATSFCEAVYHVVHLHRMLTQDLKLKYEQEFRENQYESLADTLQPEVRVKQKLFNSWLDVSACYNDLLDRRRPWFSRLSRTDTAAAPAPSRSFSFCLSLTLSFSIFFE